MEFVEGETLAQILTRLRAAEGKEEEKGTVLQGISQLLGRNDQARLAAEPEAEGKAEPTIPRRPFGVDDENQAYYFLLANAFAGVAEGLQHAHAKGVVHRDIKPSNLILDREGRLRILDFGLARLEGQESLTVTGDFVGTVLYMSPEQAMARRIPIDHRTDIYSLGATMYEMLALRPPFKGKDSQETLSHIILRDPAPLRKQNPRIPRDLETITLKCLRKEPGDRYGTAEALAQDLRRFVRGECIEARPQSQFEVFVRRLHRLRYRVATAAMVILLLILAGLRILEVSRQQAAQRDAEYRAIVNRVVENISSGHFPSQLRSGQVKSRQARTGDSAKVVPSILRAATADLKKALLLFPRRPAARYLKARVARKLGERDRAREELDQLIREEPGYIPARLFRARLHEEARRMSEASRDIEIAESLGAPWARLWFEATRALKKADWPLASERYTVLIDDYLGGQDPVDGFMLGLSLELFVGRSIALFEMGRHEAAIRDLVRANDRWPRAILPVVLLGQIYVAEKNFDEAESLFRSFFKGINLPEQAGQAEMAALSFGGAYSSDYFQYADLVLGWLEKMPPSRKRASGRLSNMLWNGREVDAIELSQDLLEEDPNDARIRLWFALAHTGLGNLRLGREHLEAALAEAPDDWLVTFFSMWGLVHFGEFVRCESHCRRTLELYPNAHCGRHNLGFRILLQRRYDDAINYMEDVLEERPLEHGIHTILSMAYRRVGKYELAKKHALTAIEHDPGDSMGRNEYALALEGAGQTEEARRCFLEAIEKTRRGSRPDCEAWRWLAFLLASKGEFDAALSAWVSSLGERGLAPWTLRSVVEEIQILLSKRPDLTGTGDFDRLVTYLKAQVEKKGNHPLYRAALGFGYLHAGKQRDLFRASQCAEEALKLDAGEILALEVQEALCQIAGDVVGSIEKVERIVDLPGHKPRHEAVLAAGRKALLPDIASFASIDSLLEEGRRTAVIKEDDTWRFLCSGQAPPEDWKSADFDDGGWEEGSGGFGFGYEECRTVLKDMRGLASSLYLRREFKVGNPKALSDLLLSVWYDGGLSVWINGEEVASVDVAPGDEDMAFVSMSGFHAQTLTKQHCQIPLPSIQAGANVLAIHAQSKAVGCRRFYVAPTLYGYQGSSQPSSLVQQFQSLAADGRRRPLRAYLRGRLLQRERSYESAMEGLTEAHECAPDEPEPLLALSRCCIAAGQARKAEVDLRRALARPDIKNPVAVYRAWEKTALGPAGYSAAEVLESFPEFDLDRRVAVFAADLRALLEKLVKEERIRINCGRAYAAGRSEWMKDCFHVGHSEARPVGGGSRAWPDRPDAPEQTERAFREGAGGYSIPLPHGKYTLRLWLPVVVGQGESPRRYNVEVEGVIRMEGISQTGTQKEVLIEESESIEVLDGYLDIVLRRTSGSPAIAAIEVGLN